MLLIVVFAVALALALERLTAQRSLDAVREDFGPTESLVDPDEVSTPSATPDAARSSFSGCGRTSPRPSTPGTAP